MASTFFTRTPSSASNMKTWTWSCWLKRSKLGSRQSASISGSLDGNNEQVLWFLADDTLKFNENADGVIANVTTNRKFRDTNAWYHIVVAYDTTQSTASNRIKIYVNGTQETSLSATTYPSQNHNGRINNNVLHHIGRTSSGFPNYFDGEMSHVHFIDGTAYDASAFGEYDANGVWTIKTSPSVTYGTNGFFILKDSASVTDQSGNGNNFTVAGGTLTNTEDNPSNVFATFNPLFPSGSTYSNGNNNCLTVSGTYASRPTTSTLGMSSGKYYTEIKLLAPNTGDPTYALIGITGRPLQAVTGSEQYQHLGAVTYDYAYHSFNGHIMNNTGSSNDGTAYGNTYTTNDIIGIALDLDNNKLYFSKNGTWQNSGDPTSGASGTGAVSITDPASTSLGNYFFGVDAYHYTPQYNYSANFGNGYFGTTAVASAGTNASGIGIFEYDVPTGYTALSTKGLNL